MTIQIQTGSGTPVDATPTQIDQIKTDLGLEQVNNTADSAKPVSTAQAAADSVVANAAATALGTHTGNTSNPHATTKAQVGLGNVDNTADVNKPVSTAQATADSAVAAAASSALGSHTGSTSNPHSVTKAQVGLGNVDNTSDANKPVSTAQAATLAPKNSPVFTGPMTAGGSQIVPFSAMTGNVIDVGLMGNIASIGADAQFTYSATPTAGTVWRMLLTITSPSMITLPAFKTRASQALANRARLGVGVHALFFEYDGVDTYITGLPDGGDFWDAAITPLELALRYAFSLASGAFGSSAPDATVGTARFPWKPTSIYVKGAIRTNAGKLYEVTGAGLSAGATGPTHTSGTAFDNTVIWQYLGVDPDAWQPSTVYNTLGTFVTNLGALYRLVTTGTSATSGGPNVNSTNINDNTCQWNRVQQFFCDTVNGNDANISGTGQTPLTPTKTFSRSGIEAVANSKYWNAGGSTFAVDAITGSGAIRLSATGSCMTVYDPFTGNEIRNHPNPYGRRLRGLWVTPDELATMYYKIVSDCNVRGKSTIAVTGGVNGSGGGTLARALVRGAWVTGCYYGLRAAGGGVTPWRFEDCVLENNGAQQDAALAYGGAQLRIEDTASGSTYARLFIRAEGYGEDAIWMASPGSVNATFSDCAVYHRPGGTNNSGHMDCVQLNRYPGTLTITRCIFEHYLPGTDLVNDAAQGVDNVGAVIISDSTGTSVASTVNMTDCILISNLMTVNLALTPGTQTRCVNLVVKFNREQDAQVTNFGSTATQTDCVNIMTGANVSTDLVHRATVPTKTRTLDLVL